jgi:hypothetical protein
MNRFLNASRNKFATQKIKKTAYYGLLMSLSLYVFSVPSFANRPGFSFICYVLMGALAALTITYLLLFGLDRKFDKRTILILLFLLSSFVGTTLYSREFRGILTLVLLIISFFIIYLAMMIINNNTLICRCITLAFFAFAVYFLIHYASDILNYKSYSYDEFRLGWDFENPNTVGSFMTLGLSLSSYIVLFEKGKLKFLFLIPLAAFLLIGFTTGSRTFLMSIFIIIICFVLFRFKKHIFFASLGIVLIITIAIVLINTVPFLATIKYRLDDTLNMFTGGGAGGSTLERILWQRYGFYLSSRRILFGFGESGFAYASGVMTYTHGNFSEMLCDFGLIGFILFYCFNLAPAFISLFTKKPNKEFVIAISFVMLIDGFLSVYYYDKCTYVIMAMCYYFLDNAKPVFKIRKNEELVVSDEGCEVTI